MMNTINELENQVNDLKLVLGFKTVQGYSEIKECVQSQINELEKKLQDLKNPFNNSDARITAVDYKGEKWVRVEALGEDFIIAPRDLDDSKEFDYDGAMARLKELGLDTFNRKQGFIIATYADEINAKLKEIGGDPMDKYCYVSKELWKPADSVGGYFSSYSWYFYGYYRILDLNGRSASCFRSRPCSAYSVKND